MDVKIMKGGVMEYNFIPNDLGTLLAVSPRRFIHG